MAEQILQPSIEPAEGLIVLTLPGYGWEDKAVCLGTTEMGFDAERRGSSKGLSREDAEIVVNFCAQCPVQEACLSKAIITGDTAHGILGGQSPSQRKKLVREFNPKASTIKESLWQRAIDDVLELKLPKRRVPKAESERPQYIRKEECTKKILGYFATLPDGILNLSEAVTVYDYLADEIDLPISSVRIVALNLISKGTITRVKEGRRIASLKLVA